MIAVFKCNILQLAILQRSRDDVEKTIKGDQSCVHERNIYGQQALHLAADWPWAIRFLLEHGADLLSEDIEGRGPLYYAVESRVVESIEILALEDTYLGSSLIDVAALRLDDDVFAIVASVVARRRKELASLVTQHLAPETLRMICVSEGSTPDLETTEILRNLEDRGYEVDWKYYDLEGKSVYEHDGARAETFQLLYDAGFTNVDRTMAGDTTLVQVLFPWKNVKYYNIFINFSEIWLWLHGKGVSFDFPVVDSPPSYPGILCIHLCAAEAARVIRLRDRDLYVSSPSDTMQLVQIVLSPQYATCTDSCRCCCSEKGCTPATDFLKILFWESPDHLEEGEERLYRQSAVIDYVARNLSDPVEEVFFAAAIRMAIFKSLGIRHLCCPLGWGDYDTVIDKEEAQELRDEDKGAVKDFEILLPQATQQWEQTESTFELFWKEFYNQNIRPKRDPRDEDYVKKMQELGVCAGGQSSTSLQVSELPQTVDPFYR